jgi:hypothetical protein
MIEPIFGENPGNAEPKGLDHFTVMASNGYLQEEGIG